MAPDRSLPTKLFLVKAMGVIVNFIAGSRVKLLRWFMAGLVFMGISMAILYGLVELLGLAVPFATFMAAEASTLLRFLVNHYWVFGQRNPTLRNCIHYHIANAGAFAVWWITANVLSNQGMHYLLAGLAAVACSTVLSLTSNFFWIWRKH